MKRVPCCTRLSQKIKQKIHVLYHVYNIDPLFSSFFLLPSFLRRVCLMLPLSLYNTVTTPTFLWFGTPRVKPKPTPIVLFHRHQDGLAHHAPDPPAAAAWFERSRLGGEIDACASAEIVVEAGLEGLDRDQQVFTPPRSWVSVCPMTFFTSYKNQQQIITCWFAEFGERPATYNHHPLLQRMGYTPKIWSFPNKTEVERKAVLSGPPFT